MKTVELKTLHDKYHFFNQFMIEKGYVPKELTESFKESNKLIEAAYEKRNLKSLRSMSNDIDNQIIKYMSLSMALELKIFFKEKLGVDFEAVEKARLKAIDKILKKGKISDPIEYELLLERVDEIYSNPDRSEELNRLNEVLAAFDKKQNPI